MLTVPSVVSFTTGAGVRAQMNYWLLEERCAAAFLQCWLLDYSWR